MGYSLPALAIAGMILKGFFIWLLPVYAFLLVPIAEQLIPLNSINLSTSEKQRKRVHPIFDWMLYLNVPIIFTCIILMCFQIRNPEVSLLEKIVMNISVGVVLGANGINVAHELGHRNRKYEKWLAEIILVPVFYSHFTTEHNIGHHNYVGTHRDPATAKRNQHVFSFWWQSVTGCFASAIQHQFKISKKKNEGFISLKNPIVRGWILQMIYLGLIYLFFGTESLLYCINAGIIGFLLLETINYIEHYGLSRKLTGANTYERISARHSWNSDHTFGRIILYELTRHSDHHYHTGKKYQILDHIDPSPQLPCGYPAAILISFIPPVWYKMVHPVLDKFQADHAAI